MKKILLIEDMSDTVELVRRILTAHDFMFFHAPNAERGLQSALDNIPDLILLDLGLPDYDGQTLIGWLREEERLKSLPVIAFTAWPQETAKQMVESYGFNGYISKPIENVNKFVSTILSYIK
jgi:two-component system cell cycle response regulator DivK